MSLQDILQKILDEAKLEIGQIQKELDKEKSALQVEFEQEKKVELKELDTKKKEALEKVTQKIDSMARREVKQKMLVVRHKIITKAMNSFVEYLETLSDDKYGEILKKLFAGISAKNGVILAPSKKLELTKKFAPKDFSVEADDSIKGGFIAKLGKAEVDNTFSNLVFSEFQNEIRSFFAEKLNLI
jgi:vacuolar-type H+-ATPase subunit E/Vma4